MKQRTWPLFIVSVFCLVSVFCIRPGSAQSRITAAQAIKAVKSTMNAPGWEIAFLSTTGVTESHLAEEFRNTKGKGFLFPDGTAGQWIIEFYKDTPKTVSEKGRSGYAYPFARILATAQSTRSASANRNHAAACDSILWAGRREGAASPRRAAS
jgi:hypothetical protein